MLLLNDGLTCEAALIKLMGVPCLLQLVMLMPLCFREVNPFEFINVSTFGGLTPCFMVRMAGEH